jgi:hypothetical protein
MQDIIDCPHCHGRIIPTSVGLCPSCSRDVHDKTEIKKSEIRDEIWNRIVAEQQKGQRFKNISKEMDNWPFPLNEIQTIRDEYAQRLASLRFDAFWKIFIPSIALVFIGISISGISILRSLEQTDKINIEIYPFGIVIGGLAGAIYGWIRCRQAS